MENKRTDNVIRTEDTSVNYADSIHQNSCKTL